MTDATPNRLEDAGVVVVGMGRVGLPLAIAFAARGIRVHGIDLHAQRRQAIELGKLPFHMPGAGQALQDAVSSGVLTLSAEPTETVSRAAAIVLCVGTPLASDLRPDYSQLRSALDDLSPHLKAGQLLVLRSTVSPGTLQKFVLPHLRRCIPSLADELLLATCPERIAEGRQMEELLTLPEIVGGIDDESTHAAAALFQRLNPDKLIHRTDPVSADLAKLFTNVYRYVNFALANEFAILGEYYRVDTHEILKMANTDYPRANIPMPGPAGGPCLSKDGHFLVEELTMPDFVLMAWKLNDSVPAHTVRRLARRLAAHGVELSGTPVVVLGQSFKRDSDDTRQSPAVRISELLGHEGADVRVHDPYLPGPSLSEALTGTKALVLATNHSFYETLSPSEVAAEMDPPRVAVDCWGMLDRDGFRAAGVEVVTFGVGEEI